jgi:hypothetical protein
VRFLPRPRFNAKREIPTFGEFSRQVHIDRLPTWKNTKHGQQWLNTLTTDGPVKRLSAIALGSFS